FRVNGRLSNLNAALGLAQLRRLPQFLAARRAIAEAYSVAIKGRGSVSVPEFIPGVAPAWHRYLLIDEHVESIGKRLRRRGIMTSSRIATWYDQVHGLEGVRYSGAEALRGRILSVPIYPSLGEDTSRVASALRDVIDEQGGSEGFA